MNQVIGCRMPSRHISQRSVAVMKKRLNHRMDREAMEGDLEQRLDPHPLGRGPSRRAETATSLDHIFLKSRPDRSAANPGHSM